MRRGFVPGSSSTCRVADPGPGLLLVLSDTDARHVRSVLRGRPGDPCEVVLTPTAEAGSTLLLSPPPGLLAAAHLAEVGREVVVELDEVPRSTPTDRVRVVLCQALPQPSHVDQIVEKGTEVGVAVFVLFPADGSPRTGPDRLSERLPRWERIAREAAKQSKQSVLPSVVVAASLDDALARVGDAQLGSLVFEPTGVLGVAAVLSAALPGAVAPGVLALWVGPEGGWSEGELARFGTLDGRPTCDPRAAHPPCRDRGTGGGGAGALRRRGLVDREFPSRRSRGTLAAMVPVADSEGEQCRSCVSICGPHAAGTRRTR